MFDKDSLLAQMNRPTEKQQKEELFEKAKEEYKSEYKPEDIPSFKEFIEKEALPAPYHRKTKEFIGVLDYELEAYEIMDTHDEVCFLWPREHGKTWVVAWYIEYRMKYYGENFLYLSLTRIRFRVANWIYMWAWQQGLLKEQKGKYSRISTYHQFDFKNGARFEEHQYMSKDILGYHGFVVILDDIVDKKWETFQAKQREAEDYWDFTLQWIGKNKLIIVGTRKFEGDLLQYIMKEHEDTLYLSMKTPYRRCQCKEPNLNERGLFDYCEICGDKSLLAPQIHNQEDFERKKQKNLFAWFAEMMQDPHPITGEVWESVAFEDFFDDPVNRKYDLCFFTIDRATTMKKRSDYTGFLIGFRHRESAIRLITHDHTGMIPLERLLIKVNELLSILRDKYRSIYFLLIIEKQGGGDDFIEMARTRREFAYEVDGELVRVKNRIPEIAAIIEIHNYGEKMGRIKNRLFLPIINKTIRFMSSLKNSEIVSEILNFPHSAKLDAIDSLATAEFELLNHPLGMGRDDLQEMLLMLKRKQLEDKSDILPDHVRKTLKFSKRGRKRFIFEQ